MTEPLDALLAISLAIMLVVLPAFGWCWDIVKAFQHLNDPLTAMECFRLFGIVAFPIGIVIGYF